MKKKNNLTTILYVEGHDQFRGWFNSSLITSIILVDKAPYQQILSHGFVVNEKGHKMSKSLGNFVDPEDIVKQFGTDILRLWVVSSGFTKEVKVSIPILENLRESYQKVRNALRFLLGNLSNLPLEIKSESDLEKKLDSADYYILYKLEKLVVESQKNYNEYNFNSIYSSLLNFCVNDLSSFYFEIGKDSLYCDNLDSLRRRQIITTLYYLLQELLKIISPFLPFLAEEVYQNIPFQFGFANQKSIYLIKNSSTFFLPSNIEKKVQPVINFLLLLRQDVYQTLEKARLEKIINTNSQAYLVVCFKEKDKWDCSELNLAELLLVSKVEISWKKVIIRDSFSICQEYDHWYIIIKRTDWERCLRCWNYRYLEKSGICQRCQKVLAVCLNN